MVGAAGLLSPYGETLATEEKAGVGKPAPGWVIACRDAHLHDLGEADTAAAMAAIGVDGVEVSVQLDGTCPGLLGPAKAYSLNDPDAIKHLRDLFEPKRRRISAFCLHNAFDQRPEDELRLVRKTSEVAVELGVPAIRLDVVPRKTKDPDAFFQFAVEIGRKIVDATRDLPVRFGVENHGGTTNQPGFLRKLFDGVGSKRFGLTLDTGNFYWFGHPLSKLYDIYEEFAPWACHTHCKSIRYPEAERDRQRPTGWEYGKYCCPIYEGDIDFARVGRILQKAGYRGDLCIENESLGRFPKEQHRDILKKEADMLRRIAHASRESA